MIRESSSSDFENIIKVLIDRKINTVVSHPNVDPGNYQIIDIIEKYRHEKNLYFYKNLSREKFISLYKNAMFQIGNSSSGILEASSIPIPVINVGSRQKGRLSQPNVVFVDGKPRNLFKAIYLIQTSKFQEKLKGLKNIYGSGSSSKLAYDILKRINFEEYLIKEKDPLNLEMEGE
jgi:UDP-N-acetylglucosamine 2-epimerase